MTAYEPWIIFESIASKPGVFPFRKAHSASKASSSVKGEAFSVFMSKLKALARLNCCSGVSWVWSSLMISESSMKLLVFSQLMACWLFVFTAVAACLIDSLFEHNLWI